MMKLSNSFAGLGETFSQSIAPTPVSKPRLFLWNKALAQNLRLNEFGLNDKELAEYFSGNRLLPESRPVATAYAGHQFGHFVPQLGDGRAHLLGELNDQNGNLMDIQLKGSGQTAFSRNGDGRCAMGPAIREFIMSEAIHALGVPTARCLAVTATGEEIYRDSIQPGAVVTRVASSHLRVGSFEYFAARKNNIALEQLCDFAIHRHYPEIDSQAPERFDQLLQQVIAKQVSLMVEWLRVGFIHGVMNTDNTTISGETIDFGPCAMMGVYDPSTVFSSIDHQGRYAYGNQPSISQWNMARFAETLLPLLNKDEKQATEIAREQIDAYSDQFQQQYLDMMFNKLGLEAPQAQDRKLLSGILQQMEKKQLDYTLCFNALTESLTSTSAAMLAETILGRAYHDWRSLIEADKASLEEKQKRIRRFNPLLIPRNHHMENALASCIADDSPEVAETFLNALRSPYTATKTTLQYQDADNSHDAAYRTFCGT